MSARASRRHIPSKHVVGLRGLVQLIPHWNFWPQTLQSRVPTPAFLSSFTLTDFSWLQNRHVKTLGRGSFCVQGG